MTPTSSSLFSIVVSTMLLGACDSRPQEPPDTPNGTGGTGAVGGSGDGGSTSGSGGDSSASSGGRSGVDPERFFIYRHDRWPDWILADDRHLYWREGVQIFRAPKDLSEAPRQFGPLDSSLTTMEMAQDERYVYWVYLSRIRKVDKETEEVVEFPLGATDGYGASILVDEERIYVVHQGCLQLNIVPKDGGEPEVVALLHGSHQGGQTTLALDEAALYCGSGTTGKILRYDKASGAVTTLLEQPEDKTSEGVAVDDTYVYWLTASPTFGPEQTLSRRPKIGGAIELLSTHAGNVSVGLHWDPQAPVLYWTAGGWPNKYDLEKREFTAMAQSATGTLGGLTVDDEYVYWTTIHGIMRLPK